MKIAVAKGDGIGPEIMDAVLTIFKANKVGLEYGFVDMGKWVFDKGFSNGMTPEAQQTIENLGILFKGPMETPKGKGVKSVNVTARKTWNTYANKRTFQTLHGVDTVFSKAGIPIDLTIVRENIEDTYGGIEHMLTHDVALSRRFITRPGSLQVIRYAFEMAQQKGARRITCGHKANIMKLTDGLFLECFYEVAKEFPALKADDKIVDDLAMQLVVKPDQFDVIVMTNLQGDIISDLCAGLVGGLGFAPSANIGDHISIFEAVHWILPTRPPYCSAAWPCCAMWACWRTRPLLKMPCCIPWSRACIPATSVTAPGLRSIPRSSPRLLFPILEKHPR